MYNYNSLGRDLVKSIQTGQVARFIEDLNHILEEEPQSYLIWLFVSRAYDALGDIDNAYNSYKFLLRLAHPKRPNEDLLKEVHRFVDKTGRADLLTLAEERLAYADLTPKPAALRFKDSIVKPLRLKGSLSGIQMSVKPRTGSPPQTGNQGHSASHSAGSIVKPSQVRQSETEIFFLAARDAFYSGDLQTALEKATMAIERGSKNPQAFFVLAQTLQRLGRYDEALEVLNQGLMLPRDPQQTPLQLLKAQIFQARKQWEEAASNYEQYMRLEKRPPALRFTRLGLARLYARLGKVDDAKSVLRVVLDEYPGDQVALHLHAALDRPFIPKSMDDEAALDELVVNLPDEGIDLISPMLRRDLATNEFRDEKIVLQGKKAEVSDALRLLKKAEQARGSESGERFPFFLEAAKAFNELPAGSYSIGDFFISLTRYAMLKGGAFVSDMRRQILSGQPTLSKLRYLRDNATSYFLEALALQVRVDLSYVLIPLANYLRAQVFYKLISRNERIPDEMFEYKFAELFKYCLSHSDDEIQRIAYESVISWGAASAHVWNRIQGLQGGPGDIGRALERIRRERPYQIISEITGKEYKIEQQPGEVLHSAFFERRRQLSEIHNFLFHVQQIHLSKETFRDLDSLWQSFPSYRYALLETDADIRDRIGAILTILLPYNDRAAEERTGILFTARTEIESLLKFIQETPTFWGRVGFEPLLTRWQGAVRDIEKRRLSDIHPKIIARLEPPVFRSEDEIIEGGFLLSNVGRGTAEGAKIGIKLCSYDSKQVICELNEDVVYEEIRARDGTFHYLIQVNKSDLSDGIDVPYRLRLEVAPIFARAALDSTVHEFTLEIASGAKFSAEEIPWNEVDVPPEHLFMGREEFIRSLVEHLKSRERNKTHILYGLTRTGKTSILRYLKKELELQPLTIAGETFRFIGFEWQIENAATQSNASDLWNYLLAAQTVFTMEELAREEKITWQDVPRFRHPDSVRFRDWEDILTHLQRRGIYPVFLFDEFSFYKTMVDKRVIDASFLAAIRSFTIGGKASFMFFGTYDLREIITDPRYGITGQFVNAIEVQVSRISRDPAIKLVKAMGSKLTFTMDAIEHILHLSYQMPYFIQLLCKHCAIYALNTGRSFVGFPEVETVVRALSGEDVDLNVGCPPLSAVAFQNNMYTQQGPISFDAVLSTIAHLTRGQIHPRMVTYPEIQEVWARHGVKQFQARLADAITELTNREILISGEDEGEFAHKISVDLFRRWWANEHRNLKLQLDRLKEQE